jgi:uncharacterized small protein (DUF1192 family)
MTKPGDLPTSKGTCITAEMKKDRIDHNNPPEKMTIFDEERKKFKDWKDMYEKEHKLKQEAEGELSIMKGIETNRVKEAQARCNQLQDEVDRIKRENNDLYNKIADLTESLKSKDYFEKPDYKFLVDENHRLEQQYLEVMADNKRLAREIEDQVNRMRKSGM